MQVAKLHSPQSLPDQKNDLKLASPFSSGIFYLYFSSPRLAQEDLYGLSCFLSVRLGYVSDSSLRGSIGIGPGTAFGLKPVYIKLLKKHLQKCLVS